MMNLICEHSLINAYSDGVRPVQPQIVESVAWEFRFDEIRPLPTRSSDRFVAQVIPLDSSPTRMRMSALQTRESASIGGPAADSGLIAELMKPSAFPDAPISQASAEPVARMAAAAGVSSSKATIEPSIVAPAASPVILKPAPSQASPVARPAVANPEASPAPSRVVAGPAPSQAPTWSPAVANPAPTPVWNMPRPLANMSWSRAASAMPIKARLRATGARLEARLEASVTRMMHKLDELKAVEKLQRIADSSMHWLRQPMGAAQSHRTPDGTTQKH